MILLSSSAKLETVVASADGLQVSNDQLSTAHHFANVLFNVMRGGIFADQYQIDTADLREFVAVHNHQLLTDQADFFATLPATILVNDLRKRADERLEILTSCACATPICH